LTLNSSIEVLSKLNNNGIKVYISSLRDQDLEFI